MFIGHFAPGFAAAAHPKAPPLPVLIIASQLVDIAFFMFVPLGIESMRVTPGISVMNPMDLYHMPLTHSLLGACAWGLAFALLLRACRIGWTGAAIGGAVVVSHWFFDLLVHVSDLTLAGSPPKLGLGLWNYPGIEMPLEIGLLLVGVSIYASAHRPGWRLWILVALLLALQAVNWFGAPPVTVDASLWGSALVAFAVSALMAWWISHKSDGPPAVHQRSRPSRASLRNRDGDKNR
jgi:hypothetical protein